MDLSKIKTGSQSKLIEQERIESRKRNLLVLILSHLKDNGFSDSFKILQKESGLNWNLYETADNIDLTLILQEFENYYQIKYSKPPKLIRIVKNSGGKSKQPQRFADSATPPKIHSMLDYSKEFKSLAFQSLEAGVKRKSLKPVPVINPPDGVEIQGVGTKTGSLPAIPIAPSADPQEQSLVTDIYKDDHPKLLKPPLKYDSVELQDLAAQLTRDIFTMNPNVSWDSIAGLKKSKRLIKEAIVFPIKFPEFFKGILKPWKGILLYGPPGTGKTMLAKAVATECNTTFFNISASSLISKWRGDSEKLVRVLFDLARYHAPSTIFLDELESIMGHRSDNEHEGSKRLKTELLIQLDGLAKSDDLVFLLAASNLPWDLDMAMLRRLEKRILIDLPDKSARISLFKGLLEQDQGITGIDRESLDYEELALLTEGYSGSDINLVCREAAMRPLRALFDKLDTYDTSNADNTNLFHPRSICQADILEAIKSTKSCASDTNQKKYLAWQEGFGSEYN